MRKGLLVFQSFGQHRRELITSELALRILSILSEEELLPNVDRRALNRTLDHLLIKVVSMENLNGRKLVEGGDLCERRNGRGVDLNRNWSVDWGKKEKDYDPTEENPESAPFSEPESQIMRKLVMTFEPHVWINVHSGVEALFMPYDHKNTTPDGLLTIRMKSIFKVLNQRHFHDRCMVGSGGGSVGYLAHGTATDYMYEIEVALCRCIKMAIVHDIAEEVLLKSSVESRGLFHISFAITWTSLYFLSPLLVI
ncbi:hypothetical protein Droror1_Dr00011490 [Drosera rotundifolia]